MSYLVGIDLGTTNTVVYYLDMNSEQLCPDVLQIPQVVELGEVERLDTLPSFLYLPEEDELPDCALDLPWQKNMQFAVGTYARKIASSRPDRVATSAKSWLSADNVDRRTPLLPREQKDAARQVSPVDALHRILEHIRNAWDYQFPQASLAEQEIVLTVPASFDAVARELTVEAAEKAQLKVSLQEEPLAALYAWLLEHHDDWRDVMKPGDVLLVCDIGGGTSDFSLIEAKEEDGDLLLERVAVGDHILLGGDNMDLTLAYTVAQQLREEQNQKLDSYRIMGLRHACRQAKESMLCDPEIETMPISVLGRGSSVIGGTISTDLSQNSVQKVLLDGFFPECQLHAQPKRAPVSGLQKMDLRYESDPAVTRHLAHFLNTHLAAGNSKFPNCVLFNGGATRAEAIQQRVIDVMATWLPEDVELRVLTVDKPELAVAKGASWYGAVRKGHGIRVRAGSAHSYYIGVESPMPAVPGFVPPVQGVCVVPFGMEEGTGMDIPVEGLGLVVGENTEFRFFVATSRQDDACGDRIDDAAEHSDLVALPQLVAELGVEDEQKTPPGSLLPVKLHCELTETGTLQLSCVSEEDKGAWQLEFELRACEVE